MNDEAACRIEPPYDEPWSTPAECDHDHESGPVCSHCCPCAECGAYRALADS